MARKQYESYIYADPDGIYTYPESSVLINKFDEHDLDKAHKLEFDYVAVRLLELAKFPIEVHRVNDILKIHRYLFQDLYWWAGQYRKVNISKQGNSFMAAQSFEQAEFYMNSLLSDFHAAAKTRDEVATQLAKILDAENYFHPFREGNGRTQREVIRVLGLAKGYDSRITLGADDEIYNLYMDGTVNGDVEMLNQLFDRILEPVGE